MPNTSYEYITNQIPVILWLGIISAALFLGSPVDGPPKAKIEATGLTPVISGKETAGSLSSSAAPLGGLLSEGLGPGN